MVCECKCKTKAKVLSQFDLIYYVALSKLKGVGPVLAKNLIGYCGSAKAVFESSKSKLEKIPGIGTVGAKNVLDNAAAFEFAENEIEFCKKSNVSILTNADKKYPKRLKHCIDAPIVLYTKGNANFNASKMVAVVGTRNCTDYGKELCAKIAEDFKAYNITLVSGLAYGIDYNAHKCAVQNNLENIAVLAHGLDRIYPAVHTNLSKKIMENGSLLTEFSSNTNPDRENFPKRNRIVAGMTDATIVVESGEKGGALITAYLARDYNRDVFAFPGKANDTYSIGCNNIIRKNVAGLITNVNDFLEAMNWNVEEKNTSKNRQRTLLIDLNADEQNIVELLNEHNTLTLDMLCTKSKIALGKLNAVLLQMEMKNIVVATPGNKYKLL